MTGDARDTQSASPSGVSTEGTDAGPLTGITVVDVGRVAATPFGSLILSDLGANVIKVEPIRGDQARTGGHPRRNGVEAFFLNVNRGKRSIAVNLSSQEGVAAVLKVAASADVFLENFRPGVADAIGIGYSAVEAINKQIIYASVSGFGDNSPYASRPAYDTIIQAMTGTVDLQRFHGEGEPDVVRQVVVDKVTAMTVAQSVLAALVARAAGRGGQRIVVPLFDSMLYFLWPESMANQTFVGPNDGGRVGSKWIRLTRTQDGVLAQHAGSFKQRLALLRAVGRPELCDDPRFSTTAAMFQPDNGEQWSTAVAEAARTMTTAQLLAALEREDVPCGPVYTLDEVITDRHVTQTGVVFEWEDAVAGRLRSVRPPAQYGGTPTSPGKGVPTLGAHGRAVLAEAGFTDSEVTRLVESGDIVDGS